MTATTNLVEYRYQIIMNHPTYDNVWQHCDFATEENRERLLRGYASSYTGWQFKAIKLPNPVLSPAIPDECYAHWSSE